jgi:ubiquinone/menaquinone biosynthesis C-methylase UbiE
MIGYPAEITLLNISSDWLTIPKTTQRTYISVVGDGRQTEYPDGSFDLVFSNSVIEHVGNKEDAARFAKEMQRVGRAFYCQTPNKWFPIEPHVGTVFLHWFPWLLEQYIVFRYFTLWGLMHKPDRKSARLAAKDARLLTKRELKALFPGAEIITERVMLLPKSFIAMRRPDVSAAAN